MRVDPEGVLRERIENALITASWFEEFRERTGIAGVSQVWMDVPAWYFWFTAPAFEGAYELRLEEASENDSGAVRGYFSIRFYPSRERARSLGFSREEQLFLQSDLFDDTGTPSAEGRDGVPPPLFQVGVVEMEWGESEDDVLLTFESLDRMRMVCETDQEVDLPALGTGISLHRGTTVREVPGWRLGHVLFDRLVSLLARHARSSPARTRLVEEPGFEVGWGADGVVERPSPDDKLRSLTVALGGASGRMEDIPSTESVVFDRCWCSPPSCRSGEDDEVPWVNPDWWSLARADFKSGLHSSCGCASHA